MSVASVGFNPVSPIPLQDIRVQTVKPADAPAETNHKPNTIQSAAADIQRMGLALNRRLQFVVDQNSNQVIVKVIDKETDKVIKELPPEELQRLHRNLKEAVGLLFDEMV